MANNKTGKDAAGATFTYATDDVAGVDYPIVKLAVGDEDSSSRISTANPMPISDAGGSITVDGTLALSGEDHIGEVGGNTAVIRPTVTTDTAIYAALDVIGAAAASGLVTLTNAMRKSGGTGVLQSVVLYDDDNEKAAITLLFFNAAPSGGTYLGNGALTLSAGDKAAYLGRVDIATTDYLTIGVDAVASVRNIALPVQAVGTANLYMIPIVTSGTPTYTAGTDLKLALGFLRD